MQGGTPITLQVFKTFLYLGRSPTLASAANQSTGKPRILLDNLIIHTRSPLFFIPTFTGVEEGQHAQGLGDHHEGVLLLIDIVACV